MGLLENVVDNVSKVSRIPERQLVVYVRGYRNICQEQTHRMELQPLRSFFRWSVKLVPISLQLTPKHIHHVPKFILEWSVCGTGVDKGLKLFWKLLRKREHNGTRRFVLYDSGCDRH